MFMTVRVDGLQMGWGKVSINLQYIWFLCWNFSGNMVQYIKVSRKSSRNFYGSNSCYSNLDVVQFIFIIVGWKDGDYHLYLKRFLDALLINFKTIVLLTLKICGVIFTAITTLLTFITWDDIGKLSICYRLFYFIFIIIASLIISFLIVIFKRTKTICENGTGSILIL